MPDCCFLRGQPHSSKIGIVVNTLVKFESLAAETGIELPPLLRSLLSTEKTVYGLAWQSTWREKCLNDPPPFISFYDFEWIDADESRQQMDRWLNPNAQRGQKFLPFAQSGAGDAYCLVPIDDQLVGIARVWHDAETSQINYRSFTDFTCVGFLETFADMSHIADNFSEQEAFQSLQADVFQVTQFMNEENRIYLQSFCREFPIYREFRNSPKSRPESVLSLISQDQLAVELLKFPAPGIAPFPVVARWEVSPPPAAMPLVDWRTYAFEAGKKFAAIQSYQKEYKVELADAKNAIDQYIRGAEKND